MSTNIIKDLKQKFIEIRTNQKSKKNNFVCGDRFITIRALKKTVFIICDGMGSGHQANISATLCASRIANSIKAGLSLYTICENVANSMNQARRKNIPYSTFTIVNILNDGQFTIYSYEMPKSIIIENGFAYVLEPRYFRVGYEIVAEVSGRLNETDSFLVFTDGVSQAGLGSISSFGWDSQGVSNYANHLLNVGVSVNDLVPSIMQKVYQLNGNYYGDDTTIASLSCRNATCVNIFTGPPRDKSRDEEVVDYFLQQDGKKIVCGSSTADVLSRITGKEVSTQIATKSFVQPPTYNINGMDLVTEGAITLNQFYNLLESEYDIDDLSEDDSCVLKLYNLIISADVVRFFVGTATNLAHANISFKQLGIMNRKSIVRHIEKRLQKMGKQVDIKYY